MGLKAKIRWDEQKGWEGRKDEAVPTGGLDSGQYLSMYLSVFMSLCPLYVLKHCSGFPSWAAGGRSLYLLCPWETLFDERGYIRGRHSSFSSDCLLGHQEQRKKVSGKRGIKIGAKWGKVKNWGQALVWAWATWDTRESRDEESLQTEGKGPGLYRQVPPIILWFRFACAMNHRR